MGVVTRVMSRNLRGGRHEQGAAAVEFALVVPILVMVMFGTINMGIAFAQKASLNSAVRAAARYGSVNLYSPTADPHTCTKAVNLAKEGTSTLGMTESAVVYEVRRGATLTAAEGASALCTGTSGSTTPPCQGSTQGDSLYVIAKYNKKIFVPLTGINTTFDLKAVGVYRCEYS